jgi:replicative DNA helicase
MNARTDFPDYPADYGVAQLRVPPHSVEAESSVLGGLMMSNSSWDAVGDLLADKDFYRAEHKLIYAAVGALINANKPADIVTVYSHLENLGKAGEVGGLQYLNSLAQFVPSAANMRRYAEIVRENSVLRSLVSTCDEITTAAFNTQGRDVASILDSAGAMMSALTAGVTPDDWVSTEKTVVALLDAIQERAGGNVDSLPTGLADLDELLDGGLRPGQLVIIGARPSMGKSAMAVTIGMNVAQRQGLPVAMFSLEMPAEELASRQLAMVSHVHLSKLRRSERLNEWDWSQISRGVDDLRKLSFHISEQSGININQLRARARKHKRQYGLKLLIVDYLGLMGQTNAKDNRNTALGEATRGMKNLAKELGIPIICLAQLGREVEKRTGARPILSDLRDSGEIEQDADIVVFIDRPIMRDAALSDDWKTYAEAIVAKQRNGSLGTVPLRYVGEHVTFLNWEGEKPTKSSFGRSL